MSEKNNLLIKNANIITLDPHLPAASALCSQDGVIVFTGETAEAERIFGSETKTLDLAGATVVPGLIDSHTHLAHTGLTACSIDLVEAAGVAEIQEIISEAVMDAAAGEVIFATRLDDSQLSEKRTPTRTELDAVAPRNPVFLRHRTGHSSVANSLALDRAAIPVHTPGIQRGADGVPTGLLLAEANGVGQKYFKAEIFRQKGIEYILRLAIDEAVRSGATTVHALEDANIVECLVRMQPDLPIRVIIYPQTRDVNLAGTFNLGRFGGCGESCLDGDIGSVMTAALLEPYTCDPSQRGRLYFDDDELKSVVHDAHRRGLQVAMHAVGDRAVEQGLMAINYAQECDPRPDARHRIEHWEIHNADLANKAIDLGVWVDMQPAFNYFWRHDTELNLRTLGEQRVDLLDPVADLINAGVEVAGGSDSPVTPLNPLLGIHSAVNHSNPRQRIPPMKALEMFTLQAARIGFEEDQKGSLKVGKLSNLTVLGENPLTVEPSTIKDIPVLYTVVKGKVIYRHQPDPIEV